MLTVRGAKASHPARWSGSARSHNPKSGGGEMKHLYGKNPAMFSDDDLVAVAFEIQYLTLASAKCEDWRELVFTECERRGLVVPQ